VTAGHEKWYGFPRTPCDVTWVPVDDVAALEAAVDGRTAAVILEPVQGLAGARELSRAFVQAARRVTTRHGAVLILDEVQCGMGRTGWPFAAQAYDVAPDVLTTAKGLAGGFPASAVLLCESLAAGLGKGVLGTTFGGGPMAVALLETVIDVIESEHLLPRVQRLSARLRAEAVGGLVTSVQGMGYLLGLRTTRPARDVLAALRTRGVLAGAAADPQVVRLLPPLILEDAHVDLIVAALRDAAKELS
jgi:acetylornithine/N-succinyldiaminopimelate aminotransferase